VAINFRALHHRFCNNNNNNNNNNKGSGKKLKYNSLCKKLHRMWTLKCTILPVIMEATGILTRIKETFGSCTGKTFDRFNTKSSCTWNITHNAENTAV
jgi:hypothetical protein